MSGMWRGFLQVNSLLVTLVSIRGHWRVFPVGGGCPARPPYQRDVNSKSFQTDDHLKTPNKLLSKLRELLYYVICPKMKTPYALNSAERIFPSLDCPDFGNP